VPWVLAAACVLVTFWMIGILKHNQRQLLETERQNADYMFHIQHETRSKADQLAQVSAQNDQIVGLLESAPLSQRDLQPTTGWQASARVFWHDDHGLLLVARGLPPVPQDGSFQLWLYRKGAPEYVNVGVVQAGNSGNGLLFVPPGPSLLSMTGALLTEESGTDIASTPGQEILKVKP
jgi:hypothetical protein